MSVKPAPIAKRLNERERALIKALHADGVRKSDLVRAFGVSRSTVDRITRSSA